MIHHKKKYFVILMFFLGMIIFSCKNEIEEVNALTNDVSLPDQEGFDIEIIYSDSAIVKGKLFAPEIKVFSSRKEPVTEFPKGIKVVFYDSYQRPKSFIKANYAIYNNRKELWEARNNVLAIDEGAGKELHTEQLFWDQKKHFVYSTKWTKVVDENGIHYGKNGFEADEDLSHWELKGSGGSINVKDEPTQ